MKIIFTERVARRRAGAFTALTPALPTAPQPSGASVSSTRGWSGVGRIPASQKDKFGETFPAPVPACQSTLPLDARRDGLQGSLWLLPDRGYNVVGTTDYRRALTRSKSSLSRPRRCPPAAGQEQSGLKADARRHHLLTDDKNVDLPHRPRSARRVRAPAGDMPILPERMASWRSK